MGKIKQNPDTVQIFLKVAGFVSMILMFLSDLNGFLGMAGGMPYLAPFCISISFKKRRYVLISAILGTVLITLGLLLSAKNIDWRIILVYRLLPVMIIWIGALLIMHARGRFRNLEHLARFAVEEPNPVLRISAADKVEYANPCAISLFAGENSRLILPDELMNRLHSVRSSKQRDEIEITVGGKIYTVLLIVTDREGSVNIYGHDITDRKRLERALREESLTDGLTRIPNRRKLNESLVAEWSRALRYNTPISVLMIDIDFFKFYNDTYGHQEGDNVLTEVASILRDSVNRPGDLVARYGGEEFVVLLPGIDSENARIFAENLRNKVESLHIEHSKSRAGKYLTVSIGVTSTVPHKNVNPDWMIGSADRALYTAKAKGRNRVEVIELGNNIDER